MGHVEVELCTLFMLCMSEFVSSKNIVVLNSPSCPQ